MMSMDRSAAEQLKSIVARIERLAADISDLAEDKKSIYAEAKANGYDVTALRTIIRMRKQDADERKEQEAILDTYLAALGMLPLDEVQRSKLEAAE